jgi:hypothetical protein
MYRTVRKLLNSTGCARSEVFMVMEFIFWSSWLWHCILVRSAGTNISAGYIASIFTCACVDASFWCDFFCLSCSNCSCLGLKFPLVCLETIHILCGLFLSYHIYITCHSHNLAHFCLEGWWSVFLWNVCPHLPDLQHNVITEKTNLNIFYVPRMSSFMFYSEDFDMRIVHIPLSSKILRVQKCDFCWVYKH